MNEDLILAFVELFERQPDLLEELAQRLDEPIE